MIIKTNKNLVWLLRLWAGLISIFNLLCCFVLWILIANIFLVGQQFLKGNFASNFALISFQTSWILLVVFFLLKIICFALFWHYAYDIKGWKVKKNIHINLFFAIPMGLITGFYVLNNNYWKLANPEAKFEKFKVKDLKQKEIYLLTKQDKVKNFDENLIKKIKQLTNHQKSQELNFLAKNLFHVSDWSKVNFEQATRIQLLTFKAICEQVPSKHICDIVFNVSWIDNLTFNFCTRQNKLNNVKEYFQAYLVIDRNLTTYEELLKLKDFVKNNKSLANSLFVGIYTNNIYKVFFNHPKKKL